MSDLKPLSREAIPAALEKAERYRLLNEPAEAEKHLSRCPANRSGKPIGVDHVASRGDGSIWKGVRRERYAGERASLPRDGRLRARLLHRHSGERRAKAKLAQGTPGSRHYAYDGFREAMSWFEQAEAIRPAGNDDALLRWNTCARIIEKNRLVPREEDNVEPPLE